MTKEEFRANLYIALAPTIQNPIVIQEKIKIAEEFVFLDTSASSERLDTMAQTIRLVCDNTLTGVETCKARQDLLRKTLRDPVRHQLRAYKNQLMTYAENNKLNPINILFEDLFSTLDTNHSL